MKQFPYFRFAKSLVYIDRDIVVAYKPSKTRLNTRQVIVLHLFTQLDDNKGVVQVFRTLGQHGLAKYSRIYPTLSAEIEPRTSGIVLACRPNFTFAAPHKPRVSHGLEYIYLALVEGGKESFADRTSGIVTASINRRLKNLSSISDSSPEKDGPELAVTKWEYLASSPRRQVSLVKFTTPMSMSHQLRQHSVLGFGCRILGEDHYEPTEATAEIAHKLQTYTSTPRKMLCIHHAYMSFLRPYPVAQPLLPSAVRDVRFGILLPIHPSFGGFCRQAQIPLSEEMLEGGIYVDRKCITRGAGEAGARVLEDFGGKWESPVWNTKCLSRLEDDGEKLLTTTNHVEKSLVQEATTT